MWLLAGATNITLFFSFTLFFCSGKIDILEYLIGELDLDPVARDNAGNSTIHAAVMGNQLAAVKV